MIEQKLIELGFLESVIEDNCDDISAIIEHLKSSSEEDYEEVMKRLLNEQEEFCGIA